MVGRVMNYFGLRSKELDRIRDLEDRDIVHFRQMFVDKAHAEAVQKKIDQVLSSRSPEGLAAKAAIEKRYQQGELDFGEAARLMEDQGLTGRASYNEEVGIEYLAQHYYLPTLYSAKGTKLDYLRHIIDVESEVRFLALLREHVKTADNVLKKLDWWMFAKLDHLNL